MQALTDLDLPYLPLESEDFARDPFTHFADARRQHPWLAKCSFGYVLTQYKAIREFMLHEPSMRMSHPSVVEYLGANDTAWGQFLRESIQALNGAQHQRLRNIVSPAFTPKRANLHRPLMREVIDRLLDEWVPRGSFDFEQFAAHFPITVMCRILGASPEAIPSLRSSLEILGLGGNMDPSFVPAFEKSFLVVDEFLRKLVADRRSGKRAGADPDLLDHLLEANSEGGLTDEELANLLVFLFVAGYDTSKNILTLIMHVLLDRPSDYARCAEDPAFCRKVVDETFRYHSVASLPRVVDEDFVFRDVLLPKEVMVLLPWSMTGRDHTAVADPDSFRPERPEGSPHMAFGLGPHICLGQFIARAQIEEGLHLIAQRIRTPKRAGPVGWRTFVGVWGIRGLPIEFEPVAVAAG